jgi:hypothetical protein
MRDRIPTYVVDMTVKNPNVFSSHMEWKVKDYGKPTAENLAKYAKIYNDSIGPDGVNSHLGEGHEAVWMGVRKNHVSADYIVEWNMPLFII